MFIKEDPQVFKEVAILLAIKNGMALFDKDLEVYGIKPDGSTMLISKSETQEAIWYDAMKAIKKMYNKRLFNE